MHRSNHIFLLVIPRRKLSAYSGPIDWLEEPFVLELNWARPGPLFGSWGPIMKAINLLLTVSVQHHHLPEKEIAPSCRRSLIGTCNCGVVVKENKKFDNTREGYGRCTAGSSMLGFSYQWLTHLNCLGEPSPCLLCNESSKPDANGAEIKAPRNIRCLSIFKLRPYFPLPISV